MIRSLYRLATALTRVAPLPPKARASVAGRRGAAARWEAWATSRDGDDGPTMWFHGASVGECLALEPVLRRLRTAYPRARTVLTYVSPSAATWGSWLTDYADYLPLDRPRDVRRAFDALRPGAIVVSRCDAWPEFLAEAARRDVPVALAGAAVRPGSTRLRWPARRLYARTLGGVRFAGAVTGDDAARLATLGIPRDVISVTGDPAHDRVVERNVDLAALEPLRRWATGHRVIVAGSLEPGDVSPVARALRGLLRDDPALRAVLVPHDSRGAAGEALRAALRRETIASARWTGGGADPASRVIQVETRGMLADAYALADVAHVGGCANGVHSVVEPAAYAVPVTILCANAAGRDVDLLRDAGGLAVARGAPALAAQWRAWLADDESRLRAGLAARGALESGSAGATAEAVAELFDAA